MPDPEYELELLRSMAARLYEHFDSVRIFCSRQQGAATVGLTTGCGNFFAQQGQVGEWLSQIDAGSLPAPLTTSEPEATEDDESEDDDEEHEIGDAK
jgi:hypothetical protein